MPSYRQGRINEQLVKEISEILRTVKDPRVSGSFISITAAKCSADLKNAKIYFSAIGEETDIADIKKGLASANGYIRSQVAQRLNLRVTPELNFVYDESMAEGSRLYELLKQVEKTLPPEEEDEAETESKDE